MSARACTASYGRQWTICSGSSEPGAARRLTRRASSAMSCSHSPSPGAGRTSDPTSWSLDGWRHRWADRQPRMISSRDVLPRRGSPRATTNWRDQRAGIFIISALVRRARSRTMSKPRSNCSPSATGSPASLFSETRRPGGVYQWVVGMRVPPPVLVVHPAIAANTAEFGPVGQPPQPTRPRGCNWASGRQEPSLFVVLVPLRGARRLTTYR